MGGAPAGLVDVGVGVETGPISGPPTSLISAGALKVDLTRRREGRTAALEASTRHDGLPDARSASR